MNGGPKEQKYRASVAQNLAPVYYEQKTEVVTDLGTLLRRYCVTDKKGLGARAC